MKTYYDPIYGRIELNDLILDLVYKCPELKRLKYIGMMNFKSISMLPLTSITRLEHTIGLAYLTQIFSEANNLPSDVQKNLIIASLYHDVNCGSFGHSVEWAINRYTPFDHEEKTEWLSSHDVHPYFKNLPLFLDMPGLHKYNFGEKQKPDFKKIFQIIKGVDTFLINNKGIDLDNIDNVFRMAHYLGIAPEDKSIPLTLAQNLKIVSGIDNFILKEDYRDLIYIWHKLRSEVYYKFIYSQEYMGFEFLIFRLIYEFSKITNKESVINLFHFTDEKLLWHLADGKAFSSTSIPNIARRLLLFDLPIAQAIIRSKDFEKKDKLSKENLLEAISKEVLDFLYNKKKIPGSLNVELNLHMTTDHRKTNRKVDFYIEKNGELSKESISEDKSFILLCVLSKNEFPAETVSAIVDKAIEILKRENLGTFEYVPFAEQEILIGRLF